MKSVAPRLIAAFFCASTFLLAAPEQIELWPNGAPGETVELPPEGDTTKPNDRGVAGQPVVRIGNVSKPTISVYRPSADRESGAAVLVCPGGGYNILAWDLEGTEVCEWLNSIGVTAILLKYRVPKRANLERHAPPLQDAQRALGLVRHRAAEFGIDPQRLGVLGFSAGGHLAATLSTNHDTRTYEKIDAADDVSCRPDFALLIYPAYLTLKDEGDKLAPEIKVTEKTPPTFVVKTQDDSVRVETSLFYYLSLKNSKVPAELHIYPKGGHGYGLRRTDQPVTRWPEHAAEWMRAADLLRKKD